MLPNHSQNRINIKHGWSIVRPQIEGTQPQEYHARNRLSQEVLKLEEISNPDDRKPADWVDDSMMDDPEDQKPKDWVEEKRIVDSKAKEPDD